MSKIGVGLATNGALWRQRRNERPAGRPFSLFFLTSPNLPPPLCSQDELLYARPVDCCIAHVFSASRPLWSPQSCGPTEIARKGVPSRPRSHHPPALRRPCLRPDVPSSVVSHHSINFEEWRSRNLKYRRHGKRGSRTAAALHSWVFLGVPLALP